MVHPHTCSQLAGRRMEYPWEGLAKGTRSEGVSALLPAVTSLAVAAAGSGSAWLGRGGAVAAASSTAPSSRSLLPGCLSAEACACTKQRAGCGRGGWRGADVGRRRWGAVACSALPPEATD